MQPGSTKSPQMVAGASSRNLADAERRRPVSVLKLCAFLLIGALFIGVRRKDTNPWQTTMSQDPPASSQVKPQVRSTPQPGYLHAVGGHLEDAHGRPFSIHAINWSGFETRQQFLGGLDTEDYGSILLRIKEDGFNVLRIPFSNEMVEAPLIPFNTPSRVGQYPINKDLVGLSSVEILDRVIAVAASLDLKVILDDHRSEAGSSAEANGLWFTERFTEAAWINDWLTLTRRYRNSSAVIGFDLRNEPHNALSGGACWGCEGPRDWRLAAERAGNLVLGVNPNLLIIVEGTDSAAGQTTWWGGNLAGARSAPVRLSHPSQLVYSAHVYGPTEYKQPWFTKRTTFEQLRSLWDEQWGFLASSDTAPVLIGEFGTPERVSESEAITPGSEGQWFTSLLSYFRLHPNLGWAYWSLNAEDPYGWLGSRYGPASFDNWRNRSLRLVISDVTEENLLREGESEVQGAPSRRSVVEHLTVLKKAPQCNKSSSMTTRSCQSVRDSHLFITPSVDAAIRNEIEQATSRALATQ